MQLDAILFDFDGTLCDTISLIVDSYQYMYKKHNKRFHTAEEIIAGIGLPLEEVICKEYPEEGEAMLATYLDYNYKHTHSSYGIFIGIVPMLEELKKLGIPLGIVTAKRLENMEITLEHADLEKYFDIMVTKFDTDKHKPDPAPLQVAQKKLGLTDPSKIIYVGDAVFDVQAANNGGFISAAVAWAQTDHAALKAQKPDYWIEKPEDLVSLAKKALA